MQILTMACFPIAYPLLLIIYFLLLYLLLITLLITYYLLFITCHLPLAIHDVAKIDASIRGKMNGCNENENKREVVLKSRGQYANVVSVVLLIFYNRRNVSWIFSM